jgi:hypothetical protein
VQQFTVTVGGDPVNVLRYRRGSLCQLSIRNLIEFGVEDIASAPG